MSAFWVHLHRLAQGQLFNGGYLHELALPPNDAEASAPRTVGDALRDTPARCLPHTQIVACR
jgi:hypothetical protein